MPLNDLQCKRAKYRGKPEKLTDGRGLYLLVNQSGKYWRFNYRYQGKQKTLALGVYPDVTLSMAREALQQARTTLAQGLDPSTIKQAKKKASRELASNSFEMIGREWFEKNKHTWRESYIKSMLLMLERDIYPHLGARPIAEITPPELLKILRFVEGRGAIETSHKLLQRCGQIFRYGIATGRCERDISADLRGALKPAKPEHFKAITEPAKVGELLRAIDGYQGTITTRCAFRLMPLVFVRSGELRKMEWLEVDLDAAKWEIPADKMKMKEPHIVPLSKQAVALLREVQPLTGYGRFVFPSETSKTREISNNTLLAALRRIGYPREEMTIHGFRAMARTLLDEVLGFRVDYIEQQLAHTVKDPLGRAYNRTKFLDERRKMMQAWADYLDRLKAS